MSKICINCGFDNSDTAKFCSLCGAPLDFIEKMVANELTLDDDLDDEKISEDELASQESLDDESVAGTINEGEIKDQDVDEPVVEEPVVSSSPDSVVAPVAAPVVSVDQAVCQQPMQQQYAHPSVQQPAFQQYMQSTMPNQGYSTQPVAPYEAFVGSEKAAYYVPKFHQMQTTGQKTSWNWCSFLFGPYWLVYRKMYLLAVLVLIIPMVVTGTLKGIGYTLLDDGSFILNMLASMIGIAIAVLMGLFGNYIYKVHADKKINELLSQGNSLGIAAAGGTNVVGVVLMALAFFFLVVIPLAVLVILLFATLFSL